MFNTILIANRGEIACRIIKTARRLGIKTVAIYSTADRDGVHVALADEAFCVGEPSAKSSYLNIDAIVKVACLSGAQAIHPGYGFLSENPQFARACADANIVFIGPSIKALEAMGSKQTAKHLLEHTGVPLTPGYHGTDQSDDRLRAECEQLGYPVLLKAASGGGGKGMRTIHKACEFQEALAGARREALAYFADDTMLIEKLIQKPRHIELQLFADNHGQMVHLFERDCSIQRRHQKIIEEAPAPNLSQTLRESLAQSAIAVARAIDYRGAGTVEFLVDEQEQFYFMEMNTRLQVEHPVTELITGLDLVEWQLRIAANEPLPRSQPHLIAHGHAIECRIYAEDPTQDFMPSIGRISFLQEPVGDGIRIDSGVRCHSSISMHYDAMIAKLIAWGDNREQALQRMQQALAHYHIGGVKTNLSFLQAILSHPHFIASEITTHFLSHESLSLHAPDPELGVQMAACMTYLSEYAMCNSLDADAFGWQMHLKGYWDVCFSVNHLSQTVRIIPNGSNQLTLTINNLTTHWQAHLVGNTLHLDDGQQHRQAIVDSKPHGYTFYTACGVITVIRTNQQTVYNTTPTIAQLTAPMPATIVAVLKTIGDVVQVGETLMILEAMKMEHTIKAPEDGVISDIFYPVGTQVSEGVQLLALTSDDATTRNDA